MKITFVSPHLKISGGVRVLLIYADRLSKMGHEVTVVVVGENPIKRLTANMLCLKPSWFKQLHAKILKVPSLEEKYIPSADIIVATNWQLGREVLKYSPRVGKKFDFVQHDEGMYRNDHEEVDRVFQSPALRIITIADWLVETFKTKYHSDALLLLNSVDREQFRNTPREKSKDEVRILILHHDYEWKGTKEGVAVVQRLKAKYPNVKLILFGVRSKTIEYPCDEYYYKLPQEKLSWLYSNTDIFLCPSWDEGFTAPSVEAMTCGCALVTYDFPSSKHYASDGETAMVAKRKDPEDLFRKVEMLVKDSELRARIARGGFDFVSAMPTWEDQAKKMEKIFESALHA